MSDNKLSNLHFTVSQYLAETLPGKHFPVAVRVQQIDVSSGEPTHGAPPMFFSTSASLFSDTVVSIGVQVEPWNEKYIKRQRGKAYHFTLMFVLVDGAPPSSRHAREFHCSERCEWNCETFKIRDTLNTEEEWTLGVVFDKTTNLMKQIFFPHQTLKHSGLMHQLREAEHARTMETAMVGVGQNNS